MMTLHPTKDVMKSGSLWNIFMCLDTDLYGKDSAKERLVKE